MKNNTSLLTLGLVASLASSQACANRPPDKVQAGTTGAAGIEIGTPIADTANFLVAIDYEDVPPAASSRTPLKVAVVGSAAINLQKTQWAYGQSDWSAALIPPGGSIDALSLGLDWLSLEYVPESASQGHHWVPSDAFIDTQLEFAALLFLVNGSVHAYAWGDKVATAFDTSGGQFDKSYDVLHPIGKFADPGTAIGLDYNVASHTPWVDPLAFQPHPESAHDIDLIDLFYSSPGGQLFTSKAWRVGSDWRWKPEGPGTPLGVRTETSSGWVPVFNDGDDVTAFSYDRVHGLILFALKNSGPPFQVAKVIRATQDEEGLIRMLDVEKVAPLHDLKGDVFGLQLSQRPTGSCGVDPQHLVGTPRPDAAGPGPVGP